MAVLTVRKIPRAVLHKVKALARANGRSMEQEVRAILQAVAMERQAVCDQIEKAWKQQKRPIQTSEVDRWIRQSRRQRP